MPRIYFREVFRSMSVRKEVIPFILSAIGFGVLLIPLLKAAGYSWCRSVIPGTAAAVVFTAYFLYFFRDPQRTPPSGEHIIVAGADGKIARICEVHEDQFLKMDTVRISIFLSLFDVHVNRAPISGKSEFLGYFPGKRYFTFQEKSSEYNQHNAILIKGAKTSCLVKQIVGPVCRRVVYWPDHGKPVDLKVGEKIGMMKFGSRLDMYFPKGSIEIECGVGDTVRAGETIIAKVVAQ